MRSKDGYVENFQDTIGRVVSDMQGSNDYLPALVLANIFDNPGQVSMEMYPRF